MLQIRKNRRYHPEFVKILDKFLSNSIKKLPAKLLFILIGLLSTIWFLVRVIPKPSRASYPCMRAAKPFMSGFIAYIIGLSATLFSYNRSKRNFINARYIVAFTFLLITIFSAIFTLTHDSIPVYANSKLLLAPNQPIGRAQGIFPGRVVWMWNPNATNENCTNNFGDGWFLDKNTDINVVQSMVDEAVLKLTEKKSIKEAWDAMFKYFNKKNGKGDRGYINGEKIFIKTNQVSASNGTYSTIDFEIKNQSRYGMAETSPQVVLAILRHLVNEVGIRQENISVGDPMKHMYKHVFDMWHNEFPNVIYIDADNRLGRTKPLASSNRDDSIYYSDRGAILKSNGTSGNPIKADALPTVITEADYLIAIPALKAHARAGISVCAKLHFGSNLRGSATHLHGGLVAPNKSSGSNLREGYNQYRVLVDLMAHKHLGGKTVLFVVDALWAGSEANDPPRKFLMPPFNNDWTSSIFMSQDQVALESVCFDFLKTEFTAERQPFYGDYPQMVGVDDYILQAADSSYWPDGLIYDPENDGIPVHSLGVCEHWNNHIEKKYSRNLGIGEGIELLYVDKSITSVQNIQLANTFYLYPNYPNPFNSFTNISFSVPHSSNAVLKIYDILGNEIETLFNGYAINGKLYVIQFNASSLVSGIYIVRLEFSKQFLSRKIILLK